MVFYQFQFTYIIHLLTVYLTKFIVIVYYLINKREHRTYHTENYISGPYNVIYDFIYLFFKKKTRFDRLNWSNQSTSSHTDSVSGPVFKHVA